MTALCAKVGFVLLSNSRRPIPSTRIATLNMFPFLRSAGFDPQVVFEPETGTETPKLPDLAGRLVQENFQIVVFQKVHGPAVEDLVKQLSVLGVRTVYSVCDLVDDRMAELADATIVVTDYLKSLYSGHVQHKLHVVHDGIERPEVRKTTFRVDRGSRSQPLHAVLVTSVDLRCLPVLEILPDWLRVTIVGRYPADSDIWRRLRQVRWNLALQQTREERLAYLRFLMNRQVRCVAWEADRVYQIMCEADIGIIPIDTTSVETALSVPIPLWKVKSENRMTMKMSVGLPVVATPIPAYEQIVEHGSNGFLAKSRRDWVECLELLRDPDLRRDLGARARESVLPRFSMDEQGRRLVTVLRALIDQSPTPGGHTQPASEVRSG